jgi:hypothetical protein
VISTTLLRPVGRYDLSDSGRVQYIMQYATGSPYGQLAILFAREVSNPRAPLITVRASPSRSSAVAATNELSSGELRLAGASRPGAGGDNDIISFRNITSASPDNLTGNTGIVAGIFPVPDSLIVMKNSYYWSVFAQEAAFVALCSTPERSGLSQREVLIYDRQDVKWHSALVPGDVTVLRPVNGWIIGDVVRSDPRDDWNRRVGGPGVITDSSILIDPATSKIWVTDLGHDSEILWVDHDTVYYRSEDALYRAKIGETDFVDRALLIKDPRITYIHWAFRRSAGEND